MHWQEDEDEFEHLQDEDEFEGFDKDRPHQRKPGEKGPQELKITSVRALYTVYYILVPETLTVKVNITVDHLW